MCDYCTVVQATTTAVLQISLCKSQPSAGRLPLPLSNLYLHTARVGLWTDRLEVATVDLRFFVCRFVSRCVMYANARESRSRTHTCIHSGQRGARGACSSGRACLGAITCPPAVPPTPDVTAQPQTERGREANRKSTSILASRSRWCHSGDGSKAARLGF